MLNHFFDIEEPMRNVRPSLFAVLVASSISMLGLQECHAQYGANRFATRGNYQPYNTKPTVSPYLNLLQNGDSGNLPQYQTLVRPFLEQQAINDQTLMNNQSLRRDVSLLQNQSPRNDARVRATGHTTRFMNFSHYFQGQQARSQ